MTCFLFFCFFRNLTRVMILLWQLNLHSYLQGSAEVVYARRSDAFAALKRYNNVQLDGKPMKIEIIGVNAEMPRVNVIGGVNGRRTVVMTYALDSFSFTTIYVVLLFAIAIFFFLFLLIIFFCLWYVKIISFGHLRFGIMQAGCWSWQRFCYS